MSERLHGADDYHRLIDADPQLAADWAREYAKVAQFEDLLEQPMDEGILDTVTAFRLYGLVTVQSCEGHEDRGQPGPWVDIADPAITRPVLDELVAGFPRGDELALSPMHDVTGRTLFSTRISAADTQCWSIARFKEEPYAADLVGSQQLMREFTGYLVRLLAESRASQPG